MKLKFSTGFQEAQNRIFENCMAPKKSKKRGAVKPPPLKGKKEKGKYKGRLAEDRERQRERERSWTRKERS